MQLLLRPSKFNTALETWMKRNHYALLLKNIHKLLLTIHLTWQQRGHFKKRSD